MAGTLLANQEPPITDPSMDPATTSLLTDMATNNVTSWRYRTLAQYNPYMADNPTALAALANSNASDQELFTSAGAMYGAATANSLGSQLTKYSPSTQRSIFATLTPEQQQSLKEMGYSVPKTDLHQNGLFDTLAPVLKPLGVITGGIGKVVSPVLSPALGGLITVSDFAFGKPYRTIRQLDGLTQGLSFLAGLGAAAGVAFAPVTGGASLGLTLSLAGFAGITAATGVSVASYTMQGKADQWADAWSAAYNGEKLFKQSAIKNAKETLNNPDLMSLAKELALQSEYPGQIIDLAQDIAGTGDALNSNVQLKQIKEIGLKYFEEGSAEFQDFYDLTAQIIAQPVFQDALKELEYGKISLGRDLANLTHLRPGTAPYTWLSGGIDATTQWFMDPFMFLGNVNKIRKGMARGLTFVDDGAHVQQFLRIAERPEVFSRMEKMAEAVNTRRVDTVRRYANDMIGLYPYLLEHKRDLIAKGILGADEALTGKQVVDWIVHTNSMKSIMKGVGLVNGLRNPIIRSMNEGQYLFKTATGAVKDAAIGLMDVKAEKIMAKTLENPLTRQIVEDAVQNVSPETIAKVTELVGNEEVAKAIIASTVNRETMTLLGKTEDELVTRIVSAALGEQGSVSQTAYEIGRILGRTPIIGSVAHPFASFAYRISEGVPKLSAIPFVGDDAANEIRAYTEMYSAAHVPSYTRKIWADAILGGSSSERVNAISSFIDTVATTSGMRLTQSGNETLEKFLYKFQQAYSGNKSGMRAMDNNSSLTEPTGVLPVADMATMIPVPDLQTIRKASTQALAMNLLLGIPESTIARNAMRRYWVPSVLLRFAFIPRNASEELLGFMARGGAGSMMQDYGARRLGQKFVYEDIRAGASKFNQLSPLSKEEAYKISSDWDVPAHMRPVLRIVEKFGAHGRPIVTFLESYAKHLDQFLERGLQLDSKMFRGLREKAREYETLKLKTPQWGFNSIARKQNMQMHLQALAFGNPYSFRRMLLGGVHNDIFEAAMKWEVGHAAQIMERAGTSNTAPWANQFDTNNEMRRVVTESGSDEVRLVNVSGERTYVGQTGQGLNDQPYWDAVLEQRRRLMDDPIVREYLRPVSRVYDADIQTIVPPRQLKEFLDTYQNLRAYNPKRYNTGLEDLFHTMTLGTPTRTMFNAQVERLKPTKELRELAASIADPDDESTLGLLNYVDDLDSLVNKIVTEFPGVEVPKFSELFDVIKAANTKLEFGRNRLWIRFGAQLNYHNDLAMQLDAMPALGRDWVHQFLLNNRDELRTASHLSDSIKNWNPDKWVGQNQRLIYRGVTSSTQVQVDEQGNLILFLQNHDHWGPEFGAVSFTTSPEQALRYTDTHGQSLVTQSNASSGEGSVLLTFDADAVSRAFNGDGLHDSSIWGMPDGGQAYRNAPDLVPADQNAGMYFMQQSSRVPFSSDERIGHGEIAGWVRGLNPSIDEEERLQIALDDLNDVIIGFDTGGYAELREGMPNRWADLTQEQRSKFFDMSRLEDQPIYYGDHSIVIPAGKWSATSTRKISPFGKTDINGEIITDWEKSLVNIEAETLSNWEKQLYDNSRMTVAPFFASREEAISSQDLVGAAEFRSGKWDKELKLNRDWMQSPESTKGFMVDTRLLGEVKSSSGVGSGPVKQFETSLIQDKLIPKLESLTGTTLNGVEKARLENYLVVALDVRQPLIVNDEEAAKLISQAIEEVYQEAGFTVHLGPPKNVFLPVDTKAATYLEKDSKYVMPRLVVADDSFETIISDVKNGNILTGNSKELIIKNLVRSTPSPNFVLEAEEKLLFENKFNEVFAKELNTYIDSLYFWADRNPQGFIEEFGVQGNEFVISGKRVFGEQIEEMVLHAQTEAFNTIGRNTNTAFQHNLFNLSTDKGTRKVGLIGTSAGPFDSSAEYYPYEWATEQSLNQIQRPIFDRMKEHVEGNLRGGRRQFWATRSDSNAPELYFRGGNGEAQVVEKGTRIVDDTPIYSSPNMESKDLVSIGDQRHFVLDDVKYEGNTETLWSIMAPIFIDQANKERGKTLYQLKSPHITGMFNRIKAQFPDKILTLDEQIAKYAPNLPYDEAVDFITSTRGQMVPGAESLAEPEMLYLERVGIPYSSREHVSNTPFGELPDRELAHVYNGVNSNIWDRIVNLGFNKVIGPTIDAISRKPIAFQAYVNAFTRNKTHIGWLLETSTEHKQMIELVDNLVSQGVFKQVEGVALERWGNAGRMIGNVNKVPYAEAWTDAQALSFLRSFAVEGDLSTVVKQARAAVAKGRLSINDSEANALIKFIEQYGNDVLATVPKNITPKEFLTLIDTLKSRRANMKTIEERVLGSDPLAKSYIVNPSSDGWVTIDKRVPDANNPLDIMADILTEDDLNLMDAYKFRYDRVTSDAADYAVQAAMADIIPFLDSHEIRSQFSEYARGLMPFFYAEENFIKRWGRMFALDGAPGALALVRKMQLSYMGLKTVGIVKTNAQGKDYFIYPGSELLTSALDKIFPGASLPLTTFLQSPTDRMIPGFTPQFGAPSFNPLVSIPVDLTTWLFPEFQPVERKILGDFGAGTTFVQAILPASLRNTGAALYSFYDPDSNRRINSAMMSAIAHLEASGNGLADNATPAQRDEFLDKVRNHSRIIVFAQALAGWFTPGPPSTSQTPDDENSNSIALMTGQMTNNPADIISADYYALIQELGIERGTVRFNELHPDADLTTAYNNNLAYTVAKTVTISGAPLPTSEEGFQFYKSNENLLNQYPEAGAWLLPQDGKGDVRSQWAYDQEMIDGLRRNRTPQEFIDTMKYKEGASIYFERRDAYTSKLNELKQTNNKDGVKTLNEAWRLWANTFKLTHPLFAEQLVNGNARERRARTLGQMRILLNDPQVPKAEHFDNMKLLMDTFDQYSIIKSRLGIDNSARNRNAIGDLKLNFSSWVTTFVTENPEVRAFWLTVLQPEAGLE